MQKLRIVLALAALVLAWPSLAQAYSYAAAGKEPLIDGREAILAAVNAHNWDGAAKALTGMKDDVAYLTQHHDQGLAAALQRAVDAKDAGAVSAALRRAFTAEIERRLDGARQNINDYQASKVLVVKAKRFFDAIANDLEPARRTAAEDGLNRTLTAIGNPGVFGAGRRPADPAAFDAARLATLSALGR